MRPYQHILEAFYGAGHARKLAKEQNNDLEADMWSAIEGLMEQAKKRYENELEDFSSR